MRPCWSNLRRMERAPPSLATPTLRLGFGQSCVRSNQVHHRRSDFHDQTISHCIIDSSRSPGAKPNIAGGLDNLAFGSPNNLNATGSIKVAKSIRSPEIIVPLSIGARYSPVWASAWGQGAPYCHKLDREQASRSWRGARPSPRQSRWQQRRRGDLALPALCRASSAASMALSNSSLRMTSGHRSTGCPICFTNSRSEQKSNKREVWNASRFSGCRARRTWLIGSGAGRPLMTHPRLGWWPENNSAPYP